jgi:hypothetical protein
MKRTTKSAGLMVLTSVAGTVGALTVALPAHAADPNCTFTNNTIAILRTDKMMLVPTVQAGAKGVGGDAVLFDHQDGPFTEFDKRSGSATGSIPATGAKFDIDYTGPIDFDGHNGTQHYIGFITTTGGGTGWIQGSNPQISFTVPDGQMSCSDSPGGGDAKTATVLQATDIYNKPDGPGKAPYKDASGNNKFKPPGQVQLVAPDLCQNNWCHVVGAPEVPQGPAWIYIGDGMGTYP